MVVDAPEAEQAVLAAILADTTTYLPAAEILIDADFHKEQHRLIWRAMSRLADDGVRPEMTALLDQLRKTDDLKRAGGAAYISDLTDVLPDVANVSHYAQTVKDSSITRQLQSLGKKLQQEDNAEKALELAQDGIDIIAGKATGDTTEAVGVVSARVAQRAFDIYNGVREIEGVTTGIPMLDTLVTTFGPGDMVVLAARPKVGKTALALNILEDIVIRQGKSALMISLEMGKEELAERLIGSIGGVNTRLLKSGKLSDQGIPNDMERITDAVKRLESAKLAIEDDMSIGAAQLRAIAHRIKARQGLDIVVVDYLQLMDGPGGNNNERVGALSRGLKLLAKSLGVPVLVLSQMSRRFEIEGRDRPQLSDLRDAGGIEQDADKVMFLLRDTDNAPERALLILAKHRQGPTGDIPLHFDEEYTHFSQGSFAEFVEDE